MKISKTASIWTTFFSKRSSNSPTVLMKIISSSIMKTFHSSSRSSSSWKRLPSRLSSRSKTFICRTKIFI